MKLDSAEISFMYTVYTLDNYSSEMVLVHVIHNVSEFFWCSGGFLDPPETSY